MLQEVDNDYCARLDDLIAHCKRKYGWTQAFIAKELGVSQTGLSYRKRNRSRNSRLWYHALMGLIAVKRTEWR